MKYFILLIFLSSHFLQAQTYTAENFFEAVNEVDLRQIKKIINSKQVGVNVRDDNGKTALHKVATMMRKTSSGLADIADTDNIKIAEFLIKNGADVNVQDVHGASPLHIASVLKQVSIINFFLKKGADPNLKTNEGHTALHFVFSGVLNEKGEVLFYSNTRRVSKILNQLLENGANPNAKDIYGNTAAHGALMVPFVAQVQIALELKFFNIKASPFNIKTSSIDKYITQNMKHLDTLIKHGLDASIKNKNGESVAKFLHLAVENKEYFDRSERPFLRKAKTSLALIKDKEGKKFQAKKKVKVGAKRPKVRGK